MSELKATTVYDAYWKANSVGEGTGIQVYLKSEADKVIAELKKQVHDYAQGLYVMQARAEKEARHNKYRRCLAMAYVEWLKQMTLCDHPESILYRRAIKREHKWKEMAQKFKEAK